MGPIQAILDSASNHPPPAVFRGRGGNSASGDCKNINLGGPPPQLIAVNDHTLDLAILCDGNIIRVANLLEADKSGTNKSNRSILSVINFGVDGGAPRPGDELVPSDSIPPNTVMQGLEFSPSGSSLLVWGEKYLAVARAPRGGSGGGGGGGNSWSATPNHGNTSSLFRQGNLDPGGGRCRWTLVDMSGYAVDILRQRIVKASWHPASDNCLTVLTIDDGGGGGGGGSGAARAYVMLHAPGRERPEQVRAGRTVEGAREVLKPEPGGAWFYFPGISIIVTSVTSSICWVLVPT